MGETIYIVPQIDNEYEYIGTCKIEDKFKVENGKFLRELNLRNDKLRKKIVALVILALISFCINTTAFLFALIQQIYRINSKYDFKLFKFDIIQKLFIIH